MAIETTWDETNPAGSQSRALGDDRIREMKKQIRQVLEMDHNMSSTASATDDPPAGYHNKATLLVSADDPTEQANAGIVYTKDVSAKAELFFKDEDAHEVQITSVGKVVPGDSTVTAAKLATDAVETLKIKDANVTTGKIADGAVTPVKMTRNIASTRLATDFTSSSFSYVARTGGSVTINGVRENGSVKLSVRTVWTLEGAAEVVWASGRINRDSGAEYVVIGGAGTQLGIPDSAHTGATAIVPICGDMLFTGLSAGSHTFSFEILSGGNGPNHATNYCANVNETITARNGSRINTFELIAEEV